MRTAAASWFGMTTRWLPTGAASTPFADWLRSDPAAASPASTSGPTSVRRPGEVRSATGCGSVTGVPVTTVLLPLPVPRERAGVRVFAAIQHARPTPPDEAVAGADSTGSAAPFPRE